jgi:hypothetical protein
LLSHSSCVGTIRTHIKNIAVFIHKDDRMEVAQGRFTDKEGEGDLTRLESGMSFMQVRASMSMKEKLRQVRGAICVNRREIAHTRLEAIAGADNPYSLITIFGGGHLAIKAGGAVYVTRCLPVECTEEIPVTVNGTDAFVDPISYMIKSAGSPIHCNDVAPPRYKVGGQMVLQLPRAQGVPRSRDAARRRGPDLPCQGQLHWLGKSIYTKEQLEEFARFQDSQGTRKAYLAEIAEMAYTGRNEKGEWGLALSSAAQGSLIDIVGASFFPLYRVVGPMIFLSLMLLVWGGLQLMVTVLLRVIIIVRCKGCGIWVLTALWGTLFQLAISPYSRVDAAMESVGVRVGQMMETEAAREPEEGETRKKSMSLEDLMVAEREGEGGVTRPPP